MPLQATRGTTLVMARVVKLRAGLLLLIVELARFLAGDSIADDKSSLYANFLSYRFYVNLNRPASFCAHFLGDPDRF